MEDDCQEEEDFSFPSIVGNLPCSIDSPPWLNSTSNPTSFEGEREEDTESRAKEEEAQEKKEKGVGIVLDTSLRDGSREEKMDMLWEDFNEDFWGSSTTTEKRHAPSGDSRGFGCGMVTGLSKGSNKGGGVVSYPAKRPSVVAFVKALRKKLFLLRGGAAPGPIKARHHRSRRQMPFLRQENLGPKWDEDDDEDEGASNAFLVLKNDLTGLR